MKGNQGGAVAGLGGGLVYISFSPPLGAQIFLPLPHAEGLGMAELGSFPKCCVHLTCSKDKLESPVLGPPVVPFLTLFFSGEGSPTKIDYRKKGGSLVLSSLLEDLAYLHLSEIKDGPAPHPRVLVHLHET